MERRATGKFRRGILRLECLIGVAHDREAVKQLAERYRIQTQLIQEKSDLQTQLRAKDDALIEMGKKYEAEKNKSIMKRIWHWAIGTLGIGGIVALFVFFPALAVPLLPIAARALGWIVSMFPKAAGALGVVSTKAFDAVVKGVNSGLEKTDAAQSATVKQELSKALDQSHKNLVRAAKLRIQPV